MLATLADPILPVFAAMALGLIMARGGLFDAGAARSLNAFVYYVATPALIFELAAGARFETYAVDALAIYLGVEAMIASSAGLIAWRLLRRPPIEAVLLGLASVFANHLMLVLPIAERALGPAAAAPIEAVVFLDSAILFCGAICILEIARGGGSSAASAVGRAVARNPALWALALGLAANQFDGGPAGVATYASFVGAAAAPLSLFALGVVLANAPLVPKGGAAPLLILCQGAVFPLALALALSAAGIAAAWRDPLVLTAAGPVGAMPFVLALHYGAQTGPIATAILGTSVISVFTIALLTAQ